MRSDSLTRRWKKRSSRCLPISMTLNGRPPSVPAVIEAKIALSSQPVAKLQVELRDGKRYLREITREQFEQLIQPIIDRTAGPCKQALKDAGLKPEQIDEVVLVGGSTRIPKVRAL